MIEFLFVVAIFAYSLHHMKKHPPTEEDRRKRKKYLKTGNFKYLS